MTLSIPGYEVLDTLGKGGMATVYLARQAIFERKVALKVMSKSLAENPTFGQRFLREARIVSELEHPNIVAVYQVGVHEDMYYLAMEYLKGQELKQLVSELSIPEKIRIICDIANALGFARSKGYVHRDIKPENIIYNRETSRAVLTDFGIARAAELNASVTHTGITIGTPHYMSPEQAKGGVVDHRSDLYSLGAVMFTLLTGEVPYTAESAVAIGIKHITSPIPFLPEELESLQSIIDRLLAKSPDDRYQEASELIQHLQCIDLSLLEHVQLDYPSMDNPGLDDATTQIYTAFEPESLAAERTYSVHVLASVLHVTLLVAAIVLAILYAAHTQTIHYFLAGDIEQEVNAAASPPLIENLDSQTAPVLADVVPDALSLLPPNADELRSKIDDLEKQFKLGEASLDALVSAYRSLLEVEENDIAALTALERLHQDSLEQVNQLMEVGELDYAAKQLDEVRRLFPSIDIDLPGPAEVPPALDLASLQQQADALLDVGDDIEPEGNNALEKYQQILARDANNSGALDGLRRIEAGLVKRGYDHLERGDVTAAEVVAKKMLAIDPESKKSLALLDQVSLRLSQKMQRDEVLTEAERLLSTGLLFYPEGESAYDLFNRALQSDPGNERALSGQNLLIEALSSQVWRMVEEGQLERAGQALERPLSLWPDNQRVRSLAEAVEAVAKQ